MDYQSSVSNANLRNFLVLFVKITYLCIALTRTVLFWRVPLIGLVGPHLVEADMSMSAGEMYGPPGDTVSSVSRRRGIHHTRWDRPGKFVNLAVSLTETRERRDLLVFISIMRLCREKCLCMNLFNSESNSSMICTIFLLISFSALL